MTRESTAISLDVDRLADYLQQHIPGFLGRALEFLSVIQLFPPGRDCTGRQGVRPNALQPGDMQGIYSITKAAVVNMTRAFAKECGPFGIRVNALLPGLTKTRFASALFENREIYDRWINEIPLRRHGEPHEMAGTVLYLVSDAASYTNGECIVVDGGLTI